MLRCSRRLGEKFGFETVEIEPVEIDGELVSSTRIRKAVETGDFETARRFLGRDYTILGTVQTGAGRGHGDRISYGQPFRAQRTLPT